MPRAIDTCTCRHSREEHLFGSACTVVTYSFWNVTCHCSCKQFFPNPQPEREAFTPPITIPRLNFKRAGVSLVDTAKLLVTNQDPWASRVRVSHVDYVVAGLKYPHAMFVLALPDKPPSADDVLPPLPERLMHRFTIEIGDDVPEGEVWL